MLFDFHRKQTSKNRSSVHATYLVEGILAASKETGVNGYKGDGEDVHMQSSPYMSSSMPHEDHTEDVITTRSIILAREEDLEGKSSQQHFSALHAPC